MITHAPIDARFAHIDVNDLSGAPGESGKYDIQNIVTHEVGHFVGIDHSPIQGATMVPRKLCVVEKVVTGRLGVNPTAPLVESRSGKQDKRPWRDLSPLHGTVEAQFLHPLFLGESVAPFRILQPALAVVPWDEAQFDRFKDRDERVTSPETFTGERLAGDDISKIQDSIDPGVGAALRFHLEEEATLRLAEQDLLGAQAARGRRAGNECRVGAGFHPRASRIRVRHRPDHFAKRQRGTTRWRGGFMGICLEAATNQAWDEASNPVE